VSLVLTATVAGKRVVVGRARVSVKKAGKTTVFVRPTKAGRRALRKPLRIRVSAKFV
jgi:hypothetical protein